jgi:hypothetical protein
MTRTDSHSILLILTRAAAICVAVLQLPTAVLYAWGGSEGWSLVTLLAPISILVLAALLWLFADILLRAALSRSTNASFESDIAPGEWQYLAFATVGLWFAVDGAVDLVWWLTAAARMKAVIDSTTYQGYFGEPENLAGLIATAFQFVVGVALMFGSRGWVGLLRRIRGR